MASNQPNHRSWSKTSTSAKRCSTVVVRVVAPVVVVDGVDVVVVVVDGPATRVVVVGFDDESPRTDNTISVSARTATTPTPATNRHRLTLSPCGSGASTSLEPIPDQPGLIVVPTGRFRALDHFQR
jgi:hypothetical protein